MIGCRTSIGAGKSLVAQTPCTRKNLPESWTRSPELSSNRQPSRSPNGTRDTVVR
jgi:hypothetical protein